MRKTAIVGMGLVLASTGLIGAAPAGATTDLCSNPAFTTTCELVKRNAQHVQEELGHVPGYVDEVQGEVLEAYDTVTALVRCLISQECLR